MGRVCKDAAPDPDSSIGKQLAVIAQIHLKRGQDSQIFMAARKSTPRKIRLMSKIRQNSPVPAWVIVKTKRRVRTNPKRRQWRRTDVRVG